MSQQPPDPAMINERLACANAQAAELLAELEEKNQALLETNAQLGQANASAAELVAQLELSKAELERLNAALVLSNEENKRILGVAAHDIRSGLGGIEAIAQVVMDQLNEADPEIKKSAALIRDASGQLLELLETLLDVSRIERGRLQLEPERISITSLMQQAVQFHSLLAGKKKQVFHVAAKPEPIEAIADAKRIRQVLDNLISNAIKYAPQNTTIFLSVRKEGREAIVSVTDEGPGLSEEDLAKVFGEFQRLSATPTGGEQSHGLGLAISRKVVEQHGGRIWAENRREARGARFSFALPFVAPNLPGYRILLVDEDFYQRSILTKMLEKQGHDVKVVSDDPELLEAVTTGSYDLIFIDAEMTGMNAYETTRVIRSKEGEDCHTPIVGILCEPDDESLGRIQEAGMDGHLCKPVDPEHVVFTLLRWIGAAQLAQTTYRAGKGNPVTGHP